MSFETADRWRMVEAVLDAALKATPGERDAILAAHCNDDADLRREVESLLAAHASSVDFLATSAESFSAPFVAAALARDEKERPGLMVGRYRLIAEIGHGGMGTVWLAERADGHFESRVALKLVRRGLDTSEVVDRFLRERQILARLEHPNIARLLDGGVDDDGRPYFVMEYVDGLPITQHCTASNSSIEDRLRLFVVTARAVAYAHRNLVVHRDIKPANVLVDRDGVIKLLDFGIAKLEEEDADVAAPLTGVTRLMTREYASPEQIDGTPITTASDVYQLGILLHELLCGSRPDTDAPSEQRRPSAAVATTDNALAVTQGTTSRDKLARRLKGDLDTIVLRALRDEPGRRYPSAEDLAEDVERHLTHRPIRFGGDRTAYRFSKFVRRHRISVASTTGIALLAMGLGAFEVTRVRHERDRARYESDKATEVALLMARFLQGWSPDASDRGEVSTTKLLDDAVRRAERELRDRPDMLGATLSVLGDFHTTVGEWRSADTLLSRAQSIQRSLGERVISDLAATLARRGRLYRLTGENSKATASLQQALSMDRDYFGPRHSETLRVQRELAAVLKNLQQYAAAEPLLRDIVDVMRTDADPAPLELEVASDLAYVIYQQGRFDEAVTILQPTLDRQLALFGEVNVSTLGTMRSLGSALRDRGDLVEAEEMYRRALRVARALYGDAHVETQAAIFLLALVLERKRDLEGAESLMRQSLELARRLYGAQHPVVLGHLVGIAGIRLDLGDEGEAEDILRMTLARLRQQPGGAGPDQGDLLNRLAYLLTRRGAPDADRAYREAMAFDDARPVGQPDFATDGLHFLAWTEFRRGDAKAAEVDYRRALAVYERQLPANHPYRIAASEGLAAVLRGSPPQT